MKKEFIRNEVFLLTIAGAFGRNEIYSENATTEERVGFKKKLKNFLRGFSMQYKSGVDESEHYHNLKGLQKEMNKSGHLLKNGQITFGTVQKLLNLYLKYLWCLGEITEPPHCPVDSIILGMIDGEAETRWTKMDEEAYRRVIEKLKNNKTKNKQPEDSIAWWELREFSRR